jgi:hypothetical protein
MKLKEALKKFSHLKKLGLTDLVIERLANHLGKLLVGSKEVYLTPLAKKAIPIEVYVDWSDILHANKHKMNSDLLELEDANESKFGPRSKSQPWHERVASLSASYSCQDENHIPRFHHSPGDGTNCCVSLNEAVQKAKLNTSSGLPFLTKKAKALVETVENFNKLLDRRDPGMVYTRTAEKGKTRNTIGYPFVDTLLEAMFYIPYLEVERLLYYRAALVSPHLVAQRMTEIIQSAIATDRIIYSVDFKGFDASVLYQYIILAFEDIKSCFAPSFHEYIDYICERMYTIELVTPGRVFRGKHGIPSGSGWTNAIDSKIQIGIALLNSFISELECQVQGDDGVYIMLKEQIEQFVSTFTYAGLKLEKSKSKISTNCAVFCQQLYHIDYIDEEGVINGIYPTWRAINRLLYMERFVNFKSLGLQGKDYFGIRSLTILENCRYHPLFEELVRYVLSKEKFSMDVSNDGLERYCELCNIDPSGYSRVNQQYGSSVVGIRDFESYKLIQKILAEEAMEETSYDCVD